MRQEDGTYFPVIGKGSKSVTLTHVAFSSSKPTLPPDVDGVPATLASVIVNEKKRNKRRKQHNNSRKRRLLRQSRRHRHRHGHGNGKRRRSRRSHSDGNASERLGSSVSACTSVSDWVRLSEAVDIWGNTVSVMPYIEVGGRRTEQFTYETVCLNPSSRCHGTERRRFRSECVSKKIYSYAFIRNEAGETDWSLIEINGSCNCKVRERIRNGPRSLLDMLAESGTDFSSIQDQDLEVV